MFKQLDGKSVKSLVKTRIKPEPKQLSILHISDLHRGSAGYVSNQALLNSLQNDLEGYSTGRSSHQKNRRLSESWLGPQWDVFSGCYLVKPATILIIMMVFYYFHYFFIDHMFYDTGTDMRMNHDMLVLRRSKFTTIQILFY